MRYTFDLGVDDDVSASIDIRADSEEQAVERFQHFLHRHQEHEENRPMRLPFFDDPDGVVEIRVWLERRPEHVDADLIGDLDCEDHANGGDGCSCLCFTCQQPLTYGDLTYYHRGGCPVEQGAPS